MPIDINHFTASALGRQVRRVITKGRLTPAQLVRIVFEAVEDILPGLLVDATYSTEDLCGPELWSNWLTGEHRSAGMCMRYLSENGHLPLELASPEGKYPQMFRLKAPLRAGASFD